MDLPQKKDNDPDPFEDDGRNYNSTLYKASVAFYFVSIAVLLLFACLMPFATVVESGGTRQLGNEVKVIISIVFVLPLSWIIPMLVYLLLSMRRNKPVSSLYKVLVFFFVNPISGILLLASPDQAFR